MTVEHATDPAVSAYLLILLAAGFFAYCIAIARLGWRFARICGRPWLRRGLRISAAGAAVAVLYGTNKIIYLSPAGAGNSQPANAKSPRSWSRSAHYS